MITILNTHQHTRYVSVENTYNDDDDDVLRFIICFNTPEQRKSQNKVLFRYI